MPLRILRPALAFTLLVFLAPVILSAQNRNEWSVFSAVNVTLDVAFDRAGVLWAATTGGVVAYDRTDDSYRYFRTMDGLLRLRSTAIAFDSATGDMYVGSDDGAVSILKSSGEWKYSTEIAGATERAERSITGFEFRDGRVYILTKFGIALYNPLDSTIIESYQQFGSIPQYTAVNDLLFWHDSIWVATDHGLASAPATGRYLAFPDAWHVHGISSGLDGGRVLSLAVADDRLQAGLDTGAMEYADGRFTKRFDIVNDPITFASRGNSVVAASAFALYRYEGGGFRRLAVGLPQLIQGLDIFSDGTIGVGIKTYPVQPYSFGLTDGVTMKLGLPNSPQSNTFASLALADDGSLWTAGGGEGVSRLRQGTWQKLFPKSRFDTLPLPGIMAVSRGAGGTIWAGTSFGGFTRYTIVDTGVVVDRYDTRNSTLTPISDYNAPVKPVVGVGAVGDENGRTWMVNWDPTSIGPVLHVQLRPDESSSDGTGFEAFSTGALRNYYWIAIDQSGVKWLGSSGDVSKPAGLLWYDDNGTVTDKGDDHSDRLFESDGLPSSLQTALAFDHDGMLWIGSPKGPAYLANPGGVARDGQPPSIQKIRPLVDVPVNAIAIDALNRKWIGTDRGVYLVSADGTEVLLHYTAANSPLVDDRVLSLLADDATGDIYIGTINGLSRISTTAVRPDDPPGPITISPQPLVLPTDEPLRIGGLPGNASIKILSLSGGLVREIQSPGGAVAFWDGRDTFGSMVPSGIYVVAAGASPGKETVVGKIAVIRR
jgi:ligand-binding sensor domain-containing protein